MHQLLDLFGDDVVLAVRRRHDHHPMGIQAGATANRVALEAMVNSPATGSRHQETRDRKSLRAAAVVQTGRGGAGYMGNITFNYASTDTSDFIPTASVSADGRNATCASPGLLFLPARPHGYAEFATRSNIVLRNEWAIGVEFTDDPAPAEHVLEHVGQSHVRSEGRKGRHDRTEECRKAHPDCYIRLNAFDSTRGWETVRMSFIVNRPKVEPTLRMTRTDVRGRTQSLFPGRPNDEVATMSDPAATVDLAEEFRASGVAEPCRTRSRTGRPRARQAADPRDSGVAAGRARPRKLGLSNETPTLHMSFTGKSGRGQDDGRPEDGRPVAPPGLCPQGHLVSVTRDDLVGQYIGHTAPKTKEVLKKAMGGVLFIDEAYYLYRPDNERDYGQEAIEILLQVMENNRDDLVVILAGYGDRMDRCFSSNPGFRSRIAHHIEFPDYSDEELLEIAGNMLASQKYMMTTQARDALRDYISRYVEVSRTSRMRAQSQCAGSRTVPAGERLFESAVGALDGATLSTIEPLTSSPAGCSPGAGQRPDPIDAERGRQLTSGGEASRCRRIDRLKRPPSPRRASLRSPRISPVRRAR